MYTILCSLPSSPGVQTLQHWSPINPQIVLGYQFHLPKIKSTYSEILNHKLVQKYHRLKGMLISSNAIYYFFKFTPTQTHVRLIEYVGSTRFGESQKISNNTIALEKECQKVSC